MDELAGDAALSLTVTLIILGAALVVFGIATYKARHPAEVGEVRLIPYTGIQYVAIVVIVLMLAHVVSIVTGAPLLGRMGR
jgi:hypothetical protein